MKKLLITSLLFSTTTVFANPFVVKDIQIDGVQTGSEAKVLAGLPVRIGQTATDKDIADVVRILFLRGYDNVTADRKGNTLFISIQQRPIIADVILDGNKIIPDDALKENLNTNGFAIGDTLDREKLEEFRKSIEEHYRSVGRYNAKVETIINTLPNNRAEIKLEIKENDVALLKSVVFEGNKAFSDSKLLEQMELQPDAWWKLFGNKFDSTLFAKDIETLRGYYLDHGYAKVNIQNTDVQINDKQTEARVVVKINEGNKYTVSSARIVGNVGGISEELSPLLNKIYIGDTFSRSDVNDVENAIKVKLGEQGYATAQVNTAPTFNDEDNTIALTFVVDAGNRYSVRQIRFEGNTVSADSTLRQEMRQQEGTWLSSQLVELGKIRLERTGFFETVESRMDTINGINDQLDVVYKVKERNTGSINFAVGYGTESGFSYQASIKQDNFLGMGSSIRLSGSRSDYTTSLNLDYNEPYFTKDGVSLGGGVFYENYDNSKSDTASSYGRTSYGLNGTLGFPVNENNSYYLGLGYRNNKLKNVTPEFSRDLYKKSMNYDSWVFNSNDFEFSFGWNYNSLNRGYFPTSGVQANIGGKITIPGSDNKYYKLATSVQGFYPIDREHSWVLSGKLAGYYANGFAGKRLPFYENYSAGGIGSLRGFASGSIGPKAIYLSQSSSRCPESLPYCQPSNDVIGGNVMGLASIELIVPTPFIADKNQNSVRTSLFVDAATVWNTKWNSDGKSIYKTLPNYGDPSRVRSSAGVALQWNSPVGPLVFSYAKPIKKYEYDEIEQFQFSIGGTF